MTAMRRLCLLVVVWTLLVVPATVLGQPPYTLPPPDSPATPVWVANTDPYGMVLFVLTAISAVNAILLALIWNQLGNIRAGVKQATTFKT
jgi:hypothetical protein